MASLAIKFSPKYEMKNIDAIFQNLAISYIFEGCYLVFLTCVDLHFSEDFVGHQYEWQISFECKILSFLYLMALLF